MTGNHNVEQRWINVEYFNGNMTNVKQPLDKVVIFRIFEEFHKTR